MGSVIKNKISMRESSNKELLRILAKLVDDNPELRLGQILFNYQFVKWENTNDGVKIHDPFYEESVDTLARVKGVIEDYEHLVSYTRNWYNFLVEHLANGKNE